VLLALKDHSGELADAGTVVFSDSAKALNAFDREPRFYEYGGMLTQVLGHEGRLGVAAEQFSDPEFMKNVQKWSGDDFYLLNDRSSSSTLRRVLIRSRLRPEDNVFSLYLSSVYLRLLRRTGDLEQLIRRNIDVSVGS